MSIKILGLDTEGEERDPQNMVSGAGLSGFEFQLTTCHLTKWMSTSESLTVMGTLGVILTAAS